MFQNSRALGFSHALWRFSPVWIGRAASAVVLLFLIAFAAQRPAYSQVSATLSGTVTDPTGAAVPNAAVTLRNQATSDVRSATSNGSGVFNFPALNPGTYTLHLEAPGFKAWERADIVLNAADQRKVPGIQLQVGAQTQEVTVSADASAVAVDNAERTTVLSNADIERLSTVGRDATELLRILPGSAVLTGVGNAPYYTGTQAGIGNSGVGNYAINGTQPNGAVAEMSDGASVIDPGNNGANTQSLNTDMISEVSVQTSNFGADSPKGPVVINAIGKSGTSSFHGEGYFYARNSVLNANSYANDQAGQPIVASHYYYPGGNIGGPVLIPKFHKWNSEKKLLFWAGFEDYQQQFAGNGGNPLLSYVPTPGMRSGDFSLQSIAALCPRGYSSAQQYCSQPTGTLPNGTPIVNGQIPASAIDPGAAALMKFIPAANATATSNGGYDYVTPYAESAIGWQFHTRVDYNINDNNKLFVSYNRQIETDTEHVNKYWVGGNMVEYPSPLNGNDTSHTISLNYTTILSPTITNEAIATYVYFDQPSTFANPSAISRTAYNFPANYTGLFNNGVNQMPGINSYGASAGLGYIVMEGLGQDGTVFSKKVAPNFQDNLTWVKGTHSLKFGFYYEHTGNEQTATGVATNGQYSFGNTGTWTINGQPYAGTGNSIANALLGLTTGFTQANFAPVTDLLYHTASFYGQDSWKITKQLTITYGIRFEHIGPWIDVHGLGMAVFNAASYNPRAPAGTFTGITWHAQNPNVPNSGVNNYPAFYTSPRFGIAYDLFGSGKTVLRGGWGMYRFQDSYNGYAGAVEEGQGAVTESTNQNLTFAQIQSFRPAAPTGTVAPGSLGAVYVIDPHSTERPETIDYNFTISQRTPGNSLLEVAYVGNRGLHLFNDSNANLSNINLVPIGAFFKPDPVTGAAPTPYNPTVNDYRPFNAYQQIYQLSNNEWSKYNALQISWTKQRGRATFNLNYTWSKTIGINTANDPFNVNNDYGVLGYDRPNIFNMSYAFSLGTPLHGNFLLNGVVNGWTLSGITTFQSGIPLQTNGLTSANFGLSCQNCPNTAPLGGNYYLGSSDISIQPVVTCNPAAHLASGQYASASCFGVPSVGTNGPVEFPYALRSPAFFNSDLSLFKDFHVTEHQSVQFRFDAFNFLNHPLNAYTSTTNLSLQFTQSGGTFNESNSVFGFTNTKANNRVLELAVKYRF